MCLLLLTFFCWVKILSFHFVPLWGLLEAWEGKARRSKAAPEQNFHHEMLKKLAFAPGSATRRRAPEAFLDFCDDLSGGDEQLSTTNQAWDDPQAQRCIVLWEFHQVQEEQPKNICGILAH